MTDASRDPAPLPTRVWRRYKITTIYAAVVGTIALLLQLVR